MRSLSIIIFCLIPFACNAATDIDSALKNLVINAGSLEINSTKAILKGNVTITSDMLNISASSAEIVFKEKKVNFKLDNIKSILIEGDQVSVTVNRTQNLKCKKLLFKDDQITIHDGTISDQNRQITARKFVYNIKNDSLSIVGDSQNKVQISLD